MTHYDDNNRNLRAYNEKGVVFPAQIVQRTVALLPELNKDSK